MSRHERRAARARADLIAERTARDEQRKRRREASERLKKADQAAWDKMIESVREQANDPSEVEDLSTKETP